MQAGYDYLKVVLNTTQNGPEVETLKLIVAEGKKHNKPTIVHAVSVRDTLAAIEASPDLLVHTPHIGNLGDDPAAVKKIVDAKIPMTSTLSVFVPHFDANGTALFRDGQPFPWNTLSSAGQGPVNARLLWEAGLVTTATAPTRNGRRKKRSPTNCALSGSCSRRRTSSRSSRRTPRARRCTAPRSGRSSPASSPTS